MPFKHLNDPGHQALLDDIDGLYQDAHRGLYHDEASPYSDPKLVLRGALENMIAKVSDGDYNNLTK